MAARIASGPGFWTEWLAELDRQGLLEDLLAEDVIARALREAPAGHKYDRVLTAKMTVICVLVACLFPGAGYDSVLATAFGLSGLKRRPGAEIPSGSAFSQARKMLGEQVMKRVFELDAAVTDADLGIALLWKGMEVTAIDGTTTELARNGVLEGEFGRRPPAAAGHRARPHRDLPLDRGRDRRLPRRRERPGRPAGRVLRPRHPQPRRPRLLLHAPLDPVLRHRRGPGLAGQERREIRPAQDPADSLRRL
jgi:Insertion element 4 transposase N-terminal